MGQSIEIKKDGSWEFHPGDDGDSRLKHSREDHQVTYRIWNMLTNRFEYQVMDKVYCRSCGADGGYSARTAVYIVYLCDKCYETNQDPNFRPMPPDEEYRWRQGLKPEEDVPETSILVVPK